MKFAANISTMFTNLPMHERVQKAKVLGFDTVEAQDIYDVQLERLYVTLRNEEVNLKHFNSPTRPGYPFTEEALINADGVRFSTDGRESFLGLHNDFSSYEIIEPFFGMACIPNVNMQEQFVATTQVAIRLCDVMKSKRLHILAGNKPYDQPFDYCEATYKSNLKMVLGSLESYDVVGLIEPLSTKPNYFLKSYEQALKYVQEFNHDNLKLLLDVYHLHQIEGDVKSGLIKYLPYAGHVQISQAPRRDDPFSTGQINYEDVMATLRASNYNGHVGLEYTPKNIEDPDLSFLERYI